MSDSKATVTDFFAMNRRLLDCYAGITPNQYKMMDPHMQKDFCFQERVRIEEKLTRGTISAKDFFKAAQA